ncbi:isochorismatase [Xaviernesmea oryzae]|uniref:Isochorismatase n=1 Tax=Xaviernesmea oryzae TaxID=464029 RepID=A0A1Q9B0Y3_9HYPH|nr:isochorismatase family cysteine hydrolase [Xaviernesmea oryzae]OLP61620.1 isochorismatase [Xaviernesmea oryzae]SEL06062.1 Nicotinamidase-related amidase [Xaviernesmea oryzae]
MPDAPLPILPTLPPIAARPYAWPFDGRWSPHDTALMLLGFQAGPVASLAAQAERDAACALLAAANGLGMTVIAVRRGYTAGEGPLAARRRTLGDPIPAHGSVEWALDAQIALPQDALLLDIAGDNGFFGTDLEDHLRRRGIRNLLITGLPTEGLVHATQRAANDMGFECLAVADACKGTSDERHAAQLRITTFGNGLFGTVAPAAEVLSALRSV